MIWRDLILPQMYAARSLINADLFAKRCNKMLSAAVKTKRYHLAITQKNKH